MYKKYVGLAILALVIIVINFKVYKTSTPPKEADLSALHNPNQNYRLEIEKAQQNKQPLFVEFYGEFWQACREMKPLVEAAYKKYYKNIKFVVVDVTTKQGSILANEWQVYGIPAMYFIDKNGKLVDFYSGKLTQKELEDKLDKIAN